MLRQLITPVVRRISQRGVRRYHDEMANFKQASMDETPVPQGSWQAHHDARQRKFNLQLVAGILFLAGTVAYATAGEALYFNWAPPTPKTEKN